MVLVRFEITIMVVNRKGCGLVMAAIVVVLVECYVAEQVGRRYKDGGDGGGGGRG